MPWLTYCVDFLLSLYYNQVKYQPKADLTGLIISSSHAVTHAVPVINGKTLTEISKWVSLGGADHLSTLSQSLALWYPALKTSIQGDQVEEIMIKHTKVAVNWSDQLSSLEKEYNKEREILKEQ